MTVSQYLKSLPTDRRAALQKVRATVNASLPEGFEETIQYGMIAWIVPETVLPKTYNKQPFALAALGSQKSGMVLHLMQVYGDAKLRTWLDKAYKASGKKMDMGKGCLRFKTLDALPLDVIGELFGKVTLEAYVAAYHKMHG
jgi:uncharacterized protein YdhG (YjbR/CyaY superfamily)